MTVQSGGVGVGGAPPPPSMTAAAARGGARDLVTPAERKPSTLVGRLLYFVGLFTATFIFVFPFVWLVSA